jgi:ABC-type multidrug transport system ATPase subunit
VLGTDLSQDRRSHRRRLALVGQETFCYDDLTVAENLRFAAKASGSTAEAARGALDSLDLGPLADVRHGKLSTGQRRRLALAIGLARSPELLLLDEPHAGLDAPGRAFLDSVLKDAAANGTSVVLASHELELVRPVVDREVVLVNGQASGALAAAPAPAPAAV